jgi:hypothetical protein
MRQASIENTCLLGHTFPRKKNLLLVSEPSKDHLTLLIIGNANGGKNLEPLHVYRSENP